MADALMVTSSFLPGRGGIESYLAELASELSPRLAVVAPARREGQPIPSDLGYDTSGYPGSMLIPSARVAQEITARAHALGTTRILFGTPWPLVLLGPRLRAAGLRYAVIVHGAEMLIPSVVPVVKSRLARALSAADLLLPVSDYTGRQLRTVLERHRLRVPKSEVLPARVDLQRFHPDAATSATRAHFNLGAGPLLLCFGRLVKRKGVSRAIEALRHIARRVPDVTLAVAGTGPEMKRLQRLAARSNAPVAFLGRVPDEDAAALYATADVFLFPVADRYRGLEVEGLGVVLLEAGACGTPSVTGRSGGTTEAVIDGHTGYVVDARDEARLVQAVVRLLTDEGQRKEMGVAAREHVIRRSSNNIPASLSQWLGDVG